MHNSFKQSIRRSQTRLGLIATAILGVVAGAMAQTAGSTAGGETTIDFGPAITSAKSDVLNFFTTNATALVGLMVIGILFGIGWRLIKKGAKTIG